jgi:O-antigen/teichoic acid export membrane protein
MRIKKVIDRFKSLNYSIIDQSVVSGGNFISTLLIVRLVGISNFGIFSTCLIFLLFISSFYTASIVSPMMAIVPKRENTNQYFGSALIFQLTFSAFAFIVAFFICFAYFKFSNFALGVSTVFNFSIAVLFHHLQDFFRKSFFAVKKYRYALITDILTYIVRLLVLFYFIWKSKYINLGDVFLIYFFTSLLGCIYGALRFKYSFENIDLKKDVLAHYEIAKWLIPSGLLKWTSLDLFFIMASIILGPIALGVLKLSQNIVSIYNLFLLGLENFVPLKAGAVYFNSGLKGLVLFTKKIILSGALFTALFGIVVSFFSKQIIVFFYGQKFAQHYEYIYWFSIFILLMYFNSIITIFLITISKTSIIFKSYIAASIFSLIIFYPLITYLNIEGALIGMLFSFLCLLTFLLAHIKIGIKSWHKEEI